MKLTLAALVVVLPSLAAAAPSFESAAADSMAAFEATSIPRPAAAEFAEHARRPAISTMQGDFNGQTAGLTLDHRAWTIEGGLNGQAVKVAIDNDGKTVKGQVNGREFAINFDWTPERIAYKGAVNGSDIEYTVDWHAGIVDGFANGEKLHLEFSLPNGTVDADKSSLNGAPVGLTLDAHSGLLSGTFGGKDLRLTLVNADLSDFLENLYLFVKP
jgi:propionyl-CoA carboxylase-like protein